MKIPLDFDVVGKEPPNPEKGDDINSSPQEDPYMKAIPETPGENAMNDTEPETISKPQPYKNSGGGYC